MTEAHIPKDRLVTADKYRVTPQEIAKSPKVLDVPGVNTYKMEVAEFYRNLQKMQGNMDTTELDGAVAVCQVGEMRSRQINTQMQKMNVKLSIPRVNKNLGYGVNDLSKNIEVGAGFIDSSGNLHVNGVEDPVKTLVMCIDSSHGQEVGYTRVMNNLGSLKRHFSKQDLNLNIVVIDSDEYDYPTTRLRYERGLLND